jgi:hypothetical protein
MRPTTPTADSLSLRLPHNRLTQPHTLTRRLILQKARHHPKALTVWRHTVSGTLSLPSRGTFHHSLTVLCTIGHQGVFRLTRWSWQIHTEFHGLRATREHAPEQQQHFRLREYHPLRSHIPMRSASTAIAPPDRQIQPDAPTTPMTQHLPALTRHRFSLIPFRSPLLRESRLFSLPAGTEMFQFPTFLLPPYVFRRQ